MLHLIVLVIAVPIFIFMLAKAFILTLWDEHKDKKTHGTRR